MGGSGGLSFHTGSKGDITTLSTETTARVLDACRLLIRVNHITPSDIACLRNFVLVFVGLVDLQQLATNECCDATCALIGSTVMYFYRSCCLQQHVDKIEDFSVYVFICLSSL